MRKRKMLQKYSVVALSCVMFLAFIGLFTVAQAKDVRLKIAHIFPETHSNQAGLQKMDEILQKETGGKYGIDIYSNGVLGGDLEEVQQMLTGSLDGAVITGAMAFTGWNKLAAIEEVPFLFSTYEAAHAAWDGDMGAAVTKDIIEPEGLKVLAYWENGFRNFTNNKKAIFGPEDLKGIKFRCSQSPLRMEMFKELHATAVPMAFPEVFTALQQGTVDGQENPLPVIESARFYEVQKYLSLSGHIYSVSIFCMNKARWDSMSEDAQKALQHAALEGRDLQRKLNRETAESALARMEKAGIIVNKVNKDEFVKAVAPVWDIFRKQGGGYLIDAGKKYSSVN